MIKFFFSLVGITSYNKRYVDYSKWTTTPNGQNVAVSRESLQSALHQNRNKPRNKSGCTRVLVRGNIKKRVSKAGKMNRGKYEVIFFVSVSMYIHARDTGCIHESFAFPGPPHEDNCSLGSFRCRCRVATNFYTHAKPLGPNPSLGTFCFLTKIFPNMLVLTPTGCAILVTRVFLLLKSEKPSCCGDELWWGWLQLGFPTHFLG